MESKVKDLQAEFSALSSLHLGVGEQLLSIALPHLDRTSRLLNESLHELRQELDEVLGKWRPKIHSAMRISPTSAYEVYQQCGEIAVSLLLEALEDESTNEYAAEALIRVIAMDGIELPREALEQLCTVAPNLFPEEIDLLLKHVRSATAMRLLALQPDDTIPPMREAFLRGDEPAKIAIINGYFLEVSEFAGLAIPDLIAALPSGTMALKETVLGALVAIVTNSRRRWEPGNAAFAAPLADVLLDEESEELRVRAAKVVEELRALLPKQIELPEDIVIALSLNLFDPSDEVAAACLAVLFEFGEEAHAAFPSLQKLLTAQPKWMDPQDEGDVRQFVEQLKKKTREGQV